METNIARPVNGATQRGAGNKKVSQIRIGELAREFGVTLRALRFYEDKGLLRPERKGRTRLYSEGDRERLKLILRGRKIGFPLCDMKQILDLYASGSVSAPQLKTFLEKARTQMEWLEQRHSEIEEAAHELSEMIRDLRNRLGHDAPQLILRLPVSN